MCKLGLHVKSDAWSKICRIVLVIFFCSVFDNGERTTEAKPIFIRFTCQPSSKPNLFHYFVFVSEYRRELDYYSFFLVKQSTKRAPPTAKSGLRVFCVTILTSVLVFMAKPSIKSGGRIDVQFHSSQPSEKRWRFFLIHHVQSLHRCLIGTHILHSIVWYL